MSSLDDLLKSYAHHIERAEVYAKAALLVCGWEENRNGSWSFKGDTYTLPNAISLILTKRAAAK